MNIELVSLYIRQVLRKNVAKIYSNVLFNRIGYKAYNFSQLINVLENHHNNSFIAI